MIYVAVLSDYMTFLYKKTMLYFWTAVIKEVEFILNIILLYSNPFCSKNNEYVIWRPYSCGGILKIIQYIIKYRYSYSCFKLENISEMLTLIMCYSCFTINTMNLKILILQPNFIISMINKVIEINLRFTLGDSILFNSLIFSFCKFGI